MYKCLYIYLETVSKTTPEASPHAHSQEHLRKCPIVFEYDWFYLNNYGLKQYKQSLMAKVLIYDEWISVLLVQIKSKQWIIDRNLSIY